MVVLWLLLLVGLPTFLLGLFIWAVVKHILTAKVPSSLQHPIKFRFLHCLMLFIMALVSLLLGASWIGDAVCILLFLPFHSPPLFLDSH